MKALNGIALTLVIIGALNWLLVGLFEFNLVDAIFGSLSILTRIIYIIVGIAGLWSIAHTIVKLHGGNIKITSNEPKGAKVIIKI